MAANHVRNVGAKDAVGDVMIKLSKAALSYLRFCASTARDWATFTNGSGTPVPSITVLAGLRSDGLIADGPGDEIVATPLGRAIVDAWRGKPGLPGTPNDAVAFTAPNVDYVRHLPEVGVEFTARVATIESKCASAQRHREDAARLDEEAGAGACLLDAECAKLWTPDEIASAKEAAAK